jgi:RimJ/RimL family protein N-acetyltransferase
MVQGDSGGIFDIPTSMIDIDIMIGEFDALGRGLGSNAISHVAAVAFSDPAVPFAMAFVRIDNLASQRAFAKAGFRKDREFEFPTGCTCSWCAAVMKGSSHEPTRASLLGDFF